MKSGKTTFPWWRWMSHFMTKPTKWHVRPAKTQINLGIRPVWSESSLCAQWVAQGPRFLHATGKTLIRLGGCPVWSESLLGAQSFCWFWREVAQICYNRETRVKRVPLHLFIFPPWRGGNFELIVHRIWEISNISLSLLWCFNGLSLFWCLSLSK